VRKVALCAALLAAACAAVLGGAASASRAGNHQIYSDPAGDNQSSSSTVYASDIRQVELTSQDNGAIRIAVTLVDGPARLVDGDELDILIDYDRNRNTGQSGFDIDLVATGHNSGTTFALCRLGAQRSCEEGPADWAHDRTTTTSTHVVDFNVSAGVSAFDFGVIESYTQPGTTTSLTDIAPNSGVWTFELRADPDNDGLHGTADLCPTVPARGKFDKNHNGCPGPFALIRTKEPHFSAVLFPGYVRLRNLRVTGVPPGARVVFSSPKGGDRTAANSSGIARSRRVSGNFRYGSVITIRITKPTFVGVFLRVVVKKPQGLLVARRACIAATGGRPVKCTGKLKGS